MIKIKFLKTDYKFWRIDIGRLSIKKFPQYKTQYTHPKGKIYFGYSKWYSNKVIDILWFQFSWKKE